MLRFMDASLRIVGSHGSTGFLLNPKWKTKITRMNLQAPPLPLYKATQKRTNSEYFEYTIAYTYLKL